MSFELSQQEGEFLINLARNTVKEYLENGKTLKPPKDTPKKLFEHCGVFVTISSSKRRREGASRLHRLPLSDKPACGSSD